MDIELAKQEFTNFANLYLSKEDKKSSDYQNSLRKYNHSFRVMNLSERIAKSLELPKEEIELMKLCGLLHDIGRFEQGMKYHIFEDQKSIDHGDLGAELLKKDNLINRFTTTNQQDIIKVVKYHNKYIIPNTLSTKIRFYIDIVRDADKIDILYSLSTEELIYENDNNPISDEIMKQIKKKELVNKINIQSSIDWVVVDLAFVFDIKFKKSFEIMKEKNYHNKIIDIYSKKIKQTDDVKKLEEIRVLINNYIEEMLTC